MIIHFHFHFKTTGITRYLEGIILPLDKLKETRVFGYGINANKISALKLFKKIYSPSDTVIHTHRNNEIILALILRFFGGKFKLLFTRHAESIPSNFTVFLMSKADTLISLSPKMADVLKLPSTVVRHGVNTSLFKIGAVSWEGKKTISVVGRIRKRKGQYDVIKALAPILNKNTDWQVQFIGTIDKQSYAKKIDNTAREYNIKNQIRFIGQVNDMAFYYRESNVVIIASYSEGFSLVCLEAIASGCITIATERVGIHSEVIEHGKNGFLYPKKNIKALREIVNKIINTPQILNPKKIRASVVEKWSIEDSAKKLYAVYSTN